MLQIHGQGTEKLLKKKSTYLHILWHQTNSFLGDTTLFNSIPQFQAPEVLIYESDVYKP